MDKRAFWIGARANDWTAERAIIASNDISSITNDITSNDPPFGIIIYIYSNS